MLLLRKIRCKRKKALWLVGVLMVGVIFLSEMSGTTDWFTKGIKSIGHQRRPEKTLVVCSPYSPAGFDVARYADIDNMVPSAPLFNRLVDFSKGSTQVEPSLAESWEITQGGLVYIFHLRHGVKFHTTDYFKPTRDFNADDVVFTFNRLMNPKHPFNVACPAEFPIFIMMGMNEDLKKVVKIDPYTVKFILRQPKVAFLQNMAMEFASILSLEYAEQLLRQGKAKDINQKPIGTGPFILKRYLRDQEIRYVANKAYWNKTASASVQLDNLVFSINKDLKIHSKKMLAGECHTGGIIDQDMTSFKNNETFVVAKEPGLNVWYIAYNTQKQPLNQLKVRQALDMAIDKAALVKISKGNYQVAINIMPPNQWSYDTSLKNAPYNPAKAKALLKSAGYPKGFKLKFFLNLEGDSGNRLIAEMIQADWKKIGVKAEFISYESGEFWKRADAGEHDIILSGWAANNGDPDNWLRNILGCDAARGGSGNHARWCSKPFDHLINKAAHTFDDKERLKLYQLAQQIFKAQVPVSPLFHTVDMAVYHKSVKFHRGIIPAIGPEQFTGITVEP